jgi:hypothetical protein
MENNLIQAYERRMRRSVGELSPFKDIEMQPSDVGTAAKAQVWPLGRPSTGHSNPAPSRSILLPEPA